MWRKLGNFFMSMREIIITSIFWGFDQKTHFFERWSWFKFNNLWLILTIGLEILQPCGKRVKTKNQKALRANSNFWRNYRGEIGRGRGLLPPHLKRVNGFNFLIQLNFDDVVIKFSSDSDFFSRPFWKLRK